jgi:hypothetical protein
MKKENIKLFKMNDYDWVAAESAEQANEWYIKEYGLTDDEQPIEEVREVSLETKMRMLYNEFTEDEKKYEINNFEIVGENNEFVKVPFSFLLDDMWSGELEEPFHVASTEW